MPDTITLGRANKVSDWKALAKIFGERLCEDAKHVSDDSNDAPFRRFLVWLASNADKRKIFSRLYAEERSLFLPHEDTADVANMVNKYLDAREGSHQRNWRRRTQKHLSDILTALGERTDRTYPSFHRKVLPTPKSPPQDSTVSLADLQIEQLNGIPSRLRDQAAITLIRNEVLQAFEMWEAIFYFGQGMLFGARPPTADEDAWNRIRLFLLSIRESVELEEFSRMDHPHEGLNSPELWKAAGLSFVDRVQLQTNLGRVDEFDQA